jgi:hypothetical protein
MTINQARPQWEFPWFHVRCVFPNTSLMGPWSGAFLVAIQIKVHRIQKPRNCNLMSAFRRKMTSHQNIPMENDSRGFYIQCS